MNGFLGALSFCALGVQGEVNHHDGILLDNADQHDDAHEGVEIQLLVEEAKSQERSDAGGRQTGKNGQRMNKALIQNSKNDVDHENRRQQQQAHAGE